MPYLKISLAICVFGIISNSCMTILLSRPRLGTTINRLLAMVTFSDALLMCSHFIYVVHFELGDKAKCPVDLLTYEWVLFQLLHSNWSVYLRAFSLWLSVIMAAYRKNVLSKNEPHNQETVGLAVKLASAVAFFVMIACTPIFLQNKIASPRPPENDSTCPRNHSTFYSLQTSDVALWNENLLLKTAYWTNGILLKLCPCILLTYYLIRVVLLMYKRHRTRQRSFTRQKLATVEGSTSIIESKGPNSFMMPTSLILVTISLTTVLCEIPNETLSVMSIFMPEVFLQATYVQLGDIMDLLSLFSCMLTSILYFGMSQALRRAFLETFCNFESWSIYYRRNRNNNRSPIKNRNAKGREEEKQLSLEVLCTKE